MMIRQPPLHARLTRDLAPALLVALTVLAAVCPARADAWTQRRGEGQFILSFDAMATSHAYDGSGTLRRFDYQGSFRKLECNPYLEYGLTDRTTVVLNAYLPDLRFRNDFGSQSSFGLGDVESGLRRRLNSIESRTAVSVQATVQFPAYSDRRSPLPGNHQVDIESRLLVGRGATVRTFHVFYSGAGAFRWRSGAPADQFRSAATLGLDATHRLTLMAQYFGITGLRNGQPLTAGTNPNILSDFDLYQGEFSVVGRVARKVRIQAGWCAAFAGRNTGRGRTLVLALWKDF